MKVRVACTVFVEVEIPDDTVDPERLIEETGCPGTGVVGAAIDAAIEKGEAAGTCWACDLSGENTVLEIDGVIPLPSSVVRCK